MNPLATSIFVFACALGGALLGLFIHRLVPDRHLSLESKDVVWLAWSWWQGPWPWCWTARGFRQSF